MFFKPLSYNDCTLCNFYVPRASQVSYYYNRFAAEYKITFAADPTGCKYSDYRPRTCFSLLTCRGYRPVVNTKHLRRLSVDRIPYARKAVQKYGCHWELASGFSSALGQANSCSLLCRRASYVASVCACATNWNNYQRLSCWMYCACTITVFRIAKFSDRAISDDWERKGGSQAKQVTTMAGVSGENGLPRKIHISVIGTIWLSAATELVEWLRIIDVKRIIRQSRFPLRRTHARERWRQRRVWKLSYISLSCHIEASRYNTLVCTKRCWTCAFQSPFV